VGPAVKCGLPGARPASSMTRVPASGGGLEAMIRGCINKQEVTFEVPVPRTSAPSGPSQNSPAPLSKRTLKTRKSMDFLRNSKRYRFLFSTKTSL